jgi:OOP family OmpA-OmpF porin
MRRLGLIMAAAAAVAPMQSAQAEHKSQWYLSIAGGLNVGELKTDQSAKYDEGWAGLLAVGYQFESLRLEAEAGYRKEEATARDRLGGPAVRLGFDDSVVSYMGNAIFEVPVSEDVNVGFGAGAGVGRVKLDVKAPLTPNTEESDSGFAWQLIAQADIAITRRTELYFDYRYFQTGDLDLPPYSTPAYGSRSMDYESHSVLAGLRYHFGQPDEAAPAAPPPPPPPAPPPAAAKQFIVFFGFNKSNLTAEAQAVVAEAAATAKAQGSASIAIVGHTDSAGSNAYNDRLSVRRAGAVKDELVRLGISGGAISASGRGETELMVQTGDGVKEPQNRRATIDLN